MHSTNYWAPLQIEDDEDDNLQQPTINSISNAVVQRNLQSTILAWINQFMSKHKHFQGSASTMVLDSGVTSSFVQLEEKLPITGHSRKIVNLPDRSLIQATHTTMLPFEALTTNARKADVLPGLRLNLLVSVGKLANKDFTTIFQPYGEGVTVNKKNTLWLQLLHKPVFQGWQDANGQWWLSHNKKNMNIKDNHFE